MLKKSRDTDNNVSLNESYNLERLYKSPNKNIKYKLLKSVQPLVNIDIPVQKALSKLSLNKHNTHNTHIDTPVPIHKTKTYKTRRIREEVETMSSYNIDKLFSKK